MRTNTNKTNIEKKGIVNSAVIKNGRDTNVLDSDLPTEYQETSDANGQIIDDKWIRFFDIGSTYLKGLMALVSNSTTARNIINQKTALIIGDGFIPAQSKNVPFLQTFRRLVKKIFTSDSETESLNSLIGRVNLNNESLEDVMRKIAFDFTAFGNAMVEYVKVKQGGKEVVYIYHIPLHTAAVKKVDPRKNIIEAIGTCADWENGSREVKEIPLYPTWEKKGDSERSAVHIKNYSPAYFYWGEPSNISTRHWQEIEYRIPKYNIAKFDNGFKPSAFVQFFGQVTPAEGEKIIQDFVDFHTGTGNNNGILAQVLSDEKYKANVEIFEDKSEGSFLELERMAAQAIITGSEWSTALSGIATVGKLGSNQQIRDELELVISTVIKKDRRKIMQKIINPFIFENAELGVISKGIMLEIANLDPIGLSDKIDANLTLLLNEKRRVLGYDGLDKEQETKLKEEQNVNGNNFNQAN